MAGFSTSQWMMCETTIATAIAAVKIKIAFNGLLGSSFDLPSEITFHPRSE